MTLTPLQKIIAVLCGRFEFIFDTFQMDFFICKNAYILITYHAYCVSIYITDILLLAQHLISSHWLSKTD